MGFDAILIVLALLGIIGFFGIYIKKLKALQHELSQENQDLSARYSGIIEIDEAVAAQQHELKSLITKIGRERSGWETEFSETINEIKSLTELLDSTRAKVEAQSYGLYEPHFDFDTPDRYKQAIVENNTHQKDAIKNEQAARCDTEWKVGGSAAKGRQMVKRNLKLMLRAFNGEADAAVAKVKYNNISSLENRIDKAWNAINKLGKSNNAYLTESYFDLKIEELRLHHEYKEAKQEALEEQRELRAQMREEERALKEIEKAKTEAEKEERLSAKALEKARQELRAAGAEANEKLQAKIAGLESKLAEAQTNKERALSRAQMTKSGHVYVVSNEGSFGSGIFKIGMTRRLEPMDRVKELGDASVPFSFDVHAMIYAEDAPGLETELHKCFDARRVNMVNRRKEFFRVDIEEVAQIVASKNFDIEFTMLGEAEEFRKTQALVLAQEQTSTNGGHSASAEPAELAAVKRLAKLKQLQSEEGV